MADGWAVDGADGFVYTTDWTGHPVIRARMHWVVCEAIGAAYALGLATGERAWGDLLAAWWRYASNTNFRSTVPPPPPPPPKPNPQTRYLRKNKQYTTYTQT